MEALVHAADIQDRDGGVLLMATLFGMYPFLLKLMPTRATRTDVPPGSSPGLPCGKRRDRQAVRGGQVRGAAEAMDCGAHHRLAQSMPEAEQRLGVPKPKRARIPTLGIHQADGEKALSKHRMILDRL
jgi:hypothetical protein